ncbi:tRNA (adenosine(37)-N6)-threonylcarbamoyltransferase complex ATPase subunit type 1 TsaE [Maribacter halichondriae]|uniref:tRNA (adenosine(37)-N6)-threonylcarbamoyltransferase complex ATPase subunit type 1 TsaE n=1 Tax=Maribacter halichondriae TaxID=2980554 RepID=UPI00235A3469|nr:tRNA (adenosine(37)-N6)-threonylcarbamoyltransferase complex ATPase subunit type 1 TsaE [Maribacter sp. Hal144]
MPIQYNQTEIAIAVKQLLEKSTTKILCFYGQMGAGKTTLIKTMVQELGGQGSANSPTFGIVNEYHFEDGSLLGYHFDFYRLNDETEALDFGLEDYLAQDCWIFMEWPEKIESFLPEKRTDIQIKILDPQTRQIELHNI